MISCSASNSAFGHGIYAFVWGFLFYSSPLICYSKHTWRLNLGVPWRSHGKVVQDWSQILSLVLSFARKAEISEITNGMWYSKGIEGRMSSGRYVCSLRYSQERPWARSVSLAKRIWQLWSAPFCSVVLSTLFRKRPGRRVRQDRLCAVYWLPILHFSLPPNL